MAQVVRAPDGRRLAVEISGAPTGIAVFLMHGTPGSLLGPDPAEYSCIGSESA